MIPWILYSHLSEVRAFLSLPAPNSSRANTNEMQRTPSGPAYPPPLRASFDELTLIHYFDGFFLVIFFFCNPEVTCRYGVQKTTICQHLHVAYYYVMILFLISVSTRGAVNIFIARTIGFSLPLSHKYHHAHRKDSGVLFCTLLRLFIGMACTSRKPQSSMASVFC